MLLTIAELSYATAAAAFILLFILLLTSWRGRLHGMALTAVCFLSALWAAAIVMEVSSGALFFADLLEILRDAGWVAFLLLLLGNFQQEGVGAPFKGKPLLASVAALYLPLLAATIYLRWQHEVPYPTLAFMTGIVGRVAMAVVGMIMVEQLFRNTPAKGRWGIKYLCLGIGGMFAYDFYLYSNAMLFRHIDEELWAARGIVNALIVPLVAVSAARNPQWSLEISVSRRVLFHSAALFGAAGYLLVMAVVGYYLRFFGGNWGTVLQVVFLFGAGVMLIGILFSGALRSWLKVIISKHFFTYNYDYREEWLRFTRTLSEQGHALGERIIQAVAELVESPGGGLWVARESGRYELSASWNWSLEPDTEPVDSACCHFLEDKQWIIDLQEYRDNPEKYEELEVPGWLLNLPRAWLVVPLIHHRRLLGFVVLAQPRIKISLNWEVSDILKVAGTQAASYLAQQESAEALLVARQFESFNRMSTFMVHDLKNLVSQFSLLLSNVEKHKNNPEFQKDMVDTLDSSVQKMKRLLHKLNVGNPVDEPVPLDVERLLRQVVAAKSFADPKPEIEVLAAGLEIMADWASLERVVGNLVQNAVEATPRDGRVSVRLTGDERLAIVEIEDTGHGMSEAFIQERLFKPFESTKAAGMGIGVFESREYVRELGGQFEVSSQPGVGTTFRLMLPLRKPGHAA